MSRKQFSWLRLSFNVWGASIEAQQVISLRLAVLAGGSESTGAEAVRMVSEKVSAALEVQRAAAIAAMSGNAGLIPVRTIAIYRQRSAPTDAASGLQKHQPQGSPVELLKARRRDRSVQRACFGS
jgi:hypothetical protein